MSWAASSSPVFSAATIASGLLNLRSTTLSTAGLPPQKFGLALKRANWPFSYFSRTNGPEPTGSSPG